MVTRAPTLSADHRRKAGHYEVLGETYAKFEFFEQALPVLSRFRPDVAVKGLWLRTHSQSD
jgi:hypothetical protein